MERITVALQAAKEAGKIVKEGFHSETKEAETKKHEHDIVTFYDTKAQEVIVEIIQKNFPEDAIIGEEGDYAHTQTSDAWVIDPIDGTFAFARKIPLCAVVIAHMKNFQTELCVIYNPITEELFHMQQGQGVSLNGEKLRQPVKRPLKQHSTIIIASHKERSLMSIFLREKGLHTAFTYSADAIIQLLRGQRDAFIASVDQIWDRIEYAFLIEIGMGVYDFTGKDYSAEKKEYFACYPEYKEEYLNLLRLWKEKRTETS